MDNLQRQTIRREFGKEYLCLNQPFEQAYYAVLWEIIERMIGEIRVCNPPINVETREIKALDFQKSTVLQEIYPLFVEPLVYLQ